MPNAPQASAPALPMLRSSQAAIDLIVTEEDSGQAYYTRHYTHFEWPEGASGPTVGIGYDCGYSTAQQIKADWTGFIPDQMRAALMRAAGLKGQAAHEFVQRYGASVSITWDQAIAQFKGRELPKWEARIMQALPNAGRRHSRAHPSRGPRLQAPCGHAYQERIGRDNLRSEEIFHRCVGISLQHFHCAARVGEMRQIGRSRRDRQTVLGQQGLIVGGIGAGHFGGETARNPPF
jgi:hypothetical protein